MCDSYLSFTSTIYWQQESKRFQFVEMLLNAPFKLVAARTEAIILVARNGAARSRREKSPITLKLLRGNAARGRLINSPCHASEKRADIESDEI